MRVYYKNELLNDNKSQSPITNANDYGLEFSNGSKIILKNTSITATCHNGKITSKGSDKSIYTTIDLPRDFSNTPSSYVEGLIIPTMVVYDTANTSGGSAGYLMDKINKFDCYYNSVSAVGNTGVHFEIRFSSIPTNAASIIAFFTYLIIIP